MFVCERFVPANTKSILSDLSMSLVDYYKKGDPYEVYKQKQELGSGGGGIVYEVMYLFFCTGVAYNISDSLCVKCVPLSTPASLQVQHKKEKTNWALKELAKDSYDLYLLEREILIMKDLNHPNLIGLKEVGVGD